MKLIASIFLPLIFLSCANGKERIFVGSTPANQVVRSFLGISLTDSIDFIRWKISIQDNKYQLSCNYGIGKPNTNGFYSGGQWAKLNGSFKEEGNYFWLQNGKYSLGMAKLNETILHLLDQNKSLLAGTGGWSYTLCAKEKMNTRELKFISEQVTVKDSLAFHGRTPCLVFGDQKGNCYKLKWSIVLYADPKNKKPAGCYIRGTALQHIGRTGKWSVSNNKAGKTVYRLDIDKSEPLYFLLLDNILVLSDKDGRLLVGDEDFSYTLSRK